MAAQNPAKAQRNVSIAQRRLEGSTYRELAKEFDIDKAQISRVLNDVECKAIIEAGTKQLIALVPKAIDNYWQFLHSDNENTKYKASKDLLETTGIRATHAENAVINQFYGNTQVNVLSSEALAFADAKVSGLVVQDAEYQDAGPNDDGGSQWLGAWKL